MRILSVFYSGHEISLHSNWLGMKLVRYDGYEVQQQNNRWRPVVDFEIEEDGAIIEYEVKYGYNLWGYSANIWRNGELIFFGLNSSRRPQKNHHPKQLIRPKVDQPSFYDDLV